MLKTICITDAANSGVLDFLMRDRFVNLNILEHLRQNPDSEIYIFDDNINNGVIVRIKRRRYPEDLAFMLATDNVDFLSAFWENLPPGEVGFVATPRPIADILCRDKVSTWDVKPCKVYALKGEFVPAANPDGYTVESLTLEDAEEVEQYFPLYGAERTEDIIPKRISYIRESITHKNSACIRIDGELACFCLVHDGGSLGPLHTVEKFRRRGLAKVVASAIIEKQLAQNLIPYVHIYEDNDNSLGLVGKMPGMEYTHDCMWLGFEKK